MLNGTCIDEEGCIKYFHARSNEAHDMAFHLQNMYEVYFFISGSVSYFIEKSVYQLKHGDLFVINSNEIHKATFRSGESYERAVIMFEPELFSLLGSNDYSLLNCFINRPKGELNKIELNKHQIEEVEDILRKFNSACMNPDETTGLLKTAYLIELLVIINKVFLHKKSLEDSQMISRKLIPILDFIDDNLTGDLSLQTLAEKFFINKYYLSTLFKSNTGMNIHEYIVLKRISKAKTLLGENLSIGDACQLSGFSDYSHFIRAFKQNVGTSPGQYKKQHASVEKTSLLSR